MAHAIAMAHVEDPREEIQSECGPHLVGVTVLGAKVLLAPYIPPEKTKSGIILVDKTRDESRYQGKVGLVLMMGPIAFQDDATHRFGDTKPEVGDWVFYDIGDTKGLELGKRRARIVEDVDIHLIVQQPDSIW